MHGQSQRRSRGASPLRGGSKPVQQRAPGTRLRPAREDARAGTNLARPGAAQIRRGVRTDGQRVGQLSRSLATARPVPGEKGVVDRRLSQTKMRFELYFLGFDELPQTSNHKPQITM